MLRLNNINLDQNPELIQPPKINDNIVVIKLIPDEDEIIASDIIDVALSYSISSIDVILEIPFEDMDKFNRKQLASLVCNGGWSLSLLPPSDYSDRDKYDTQVIEWYKLWRSETMRNFEKSIYPITPYLEYLTTNYLIKKASEKLSDTDEKELIALSAEPNDPYLISLVNNMNTVFVESFKYQLGLFIKEEDSGFYKDIDLLIKSEKN